jgi:peptidoglycan-N-acetylglucosamine deacetylase
MRAMRPGSWRRRPTYHRHGPRGRGLVALTFDDGPGPHTEAVLDALDVAGARATFFVLGSRVPGREGTLRRMVSAGHEVANHSFDHRIRPRRPVSARRQLAATNALVHGATGVAPRLFRPPLGTVPALLVRLARQAGMTTVRWDVDPRDWELPAPDVLHRRVLEGARDGSIVVLHDGGGPREATVAALPGIVTSLRQRGYRLVPASELLGLRC